MIIVITIANGIAIAITGIIIVITVM